MSLQRRLPFQCNSTRLQSHLLGFKRSQRSPIPPGGRSISHRVSLERMSAWVKVVALFLLAFALFDVCTPEPCDAQLVPGPQSAQLKSELSNTGSGACSFEEDCFVCAHYAPSLANLPQLFSIASMDDSAAPVLTLAGTLFPPYHPPRA